VQCGAQPDEASNTLTRRTATYHHASDSRAGNSATAANTGLPVSNAPVAASRLPQSRRLRPYRLGQLAQSGYAPNDPKHVSGLKFAGTQEPHILGIMLDDCILIARRHEGKPQVVAFGVVQGEHIKIKQLRAFKPPEEDGDSGSLRYLDPFITEYNEPPKSLIGVLPSRGRALRRLDPAKDDHKKICDWMELHLSNRDSTHCLGRLSSQRIQELRLKQPEFICRVSAGDAILMRPLLLHAAGRSQNDRPRRVLHIEYAGFSLPDELQWHEGV